MVRPLPCSMAQHVVSAGNGVQITVCGRQPSYHVGGIYKHFICDVWGHISQVMSIDVDTLKITHENMVRDL